MSKDRIKRTVEIDTPKLSYGIVEDNIKHLQGKILTLVEATITNDQQLNATKSLIKDYVNEKLTHLFSMYGHQTDMETPNYNPINLVGGYND